MPTLSVSLYGPVGAIILAAVGAVLFGLAAVRQHEAVTAEVEPTHMGARERIVSALRLLRRPAWLLGAAQAGLGGALHIVALILAPITLVQPIGVLAVPVTVLATALRRGRPPHRRPVFGASLSVVGVATLTVFLLGAAHGSMTSPSWVTLAVTVVAIVAAGLVLTLTGGRGRPLFRCVSFAVTAAVLFGLNSILIRVLGHVGSKPSWTAHLPLLLTAAIGLAVALPLGVWAMQTAYLSGSPQVVICCLTLMDPVTAVIGGRLLLHDGGPITGWILVGAVLCALVAAAGVVLLSTRADDPDPSRVATPTLVEATPS